jgi:hypothetical protein
MIKLAIIGGGFYGCYLAHKLKDKLKSKVKVDLFEKNKSLILEAGKNNQNKLHHGYHYPRSNQTIQQTILGSKIFTNEFKKFIYFPKKNLYLIHKKSFVNASKFYKIFKKKKLGIVNYNTKKIKFLKNYNEYDGAFNTNEGVINLEKLNTYIIKKINKNCNIFFRKKIIKIDSIKGSLTDQDNIKYKNYDFIINCTYTNPNMGLKNKFKIKYELAGMVLFRNPFKEKFGITIMDGEFITFYPRDNKFSCLSSVKYTPIKKFKRLEDLYKFKTKMNKKNISNRIKLIENDVKKYFNNDFKIKNSKLIMAPKTKLYEDNKDQRPSLIRNYKKTFSILAGKIDVAPLIYNHLIKKIK